jgi:hypothetical protein
VTFHATLDAATDGAAAPPSAYALHPIVGTRQPTPTTARLVGERIETSDAIEGAREGGDGTVPRLSAAPKALSPDDLRPRYAPDQHLGLHSHQAVLDELEGVLTARPVIHRGLAGLEIGLRTEALLLLGEPLLVWAEVAANQPLGLMAELLNESGPLMEQREAGEHQAAKESLRESLALLLPLLQAYRDAFLPLAQKHADDYFETLRQLGQETDPELMAAYAAAFADDQDAGAT